MFHTNKSKYNRKENEETMKERNAVETNAREANVFRSRLLRYRKEQNVKAQKLVNLKIELHGIKDRQEIEENRYLLRMKATKWKIPSHDGFHFFFLTRNTRSTIMYKLG